MGALGAKYRTIVLTAFAVAGSVAGAMAVRAQTISLPAIDVVSSRLQPTVPGEPVTSQADLGIVGASTTIISREDIERAPEQTIKDILSREAGVQTSSLYGAVNGNGTTVDVRGFGVTGPSNTLILINGRRLNDWDLPGFNLSTIDRQSIERIEITRGNSGAVLYGDGAVGGVINIVTRTGVGQPPSALFEAGYGSYRTRLGTAAVSASSGPYSASFYGNLLDTDGYRMNNALRQGTAVGDLRYTTDVASAYLNIAGDEQSLGLPGPRRIDVTTGLNQYVTDPRGTNTPLDYGDTQGWRITAGATRQLGNGVELILDGGFREKLQQAGFFPLFSEAYVDTTLTTASLTPRVNIRNQLLGMANNVIAGIDLYRTDYHSDRSFAKGLPVIHQYTGRQDMFAVYGQQTLGVLPTTDVSFGARAQWNDTSVRDVYDPNAPQNATFPQGGPLDQQEWNYAAHLGVQHRVSRDFTLFGRVARSFRVPNVDERIGNGALVFPLQPPTFDLKTQTSHDIEAGVKADIGRVTVQTSVYQMDLENELHLNPINFANSNLDPTRRRGVETIVTAKLADNLRLKGNLTFTDARFREGPFAGKFVPVVSQWTGNAMLSWDILPKQLVADFVLRYASDRFLDNDEFNRGTYKIPAHTLVDVRIGGEYKNLVWSFVVENLFDEKYFDYGLDTSFTFLGTTFLSYNVYPQPGRTFLGKIGVKLP